MRIFLKVQSEFSDQSTTKKIAHRQPLQTIFGVVRSECFSYRMLKFYESSYGIFLKKFVFKCVWKNFLKCQDDILDYVVTPH